MATPNECSEQRTDWERVEPQREPTSQRILFAEGEKKSKAIRESILSWVKESVGGAGGNGMKGNKWSKLCRAGKAS